MLIEFILQELPDGNTYCTIDVDEIRLIERNGTGTNLYYKRLKGIYTTLEESYGEVIEKIKGYRRVVRHG